MASLAVYTEDPWGTEQCLQSRCDHTKTYFEDAAQHPHAPAVQSLRDNDMSIAMFAASETSHHNLNVPRGKMITTRSTFLLLPVLTCERLPRTGAVIRWADCSRPERFPCKRD